MSQQLKKFKRDQIRTAQKRLKTDYPKELTIVAEGYRKIANSYHEKITEVIQEDPVKIFKHLIV